MTHQLQNLRDQSAKLRRLSQPYFFPYTDDNGWQFVGLLVCLLTCVAGIVLFLVTGLMNGLTWLLPELTGQYFGGVQSSCPCMLRASAHVLCTSAARARRRGTPTAGGGCTGTGRDGR